MDINHEKLTLAADFTKQCLLPEFDQEIGNQQIDRDDFKLFVYGLNQNLRLLFDIINKNRDLLFKKIDETKPFRIAFVLLLCEQTSDGDVPFQTDDKSLLDYLCGLVRKHLHEVLDDKKIYDGVLDTYKSKLRTNIWKKNLGAVYGYERFCQARYSHPKSRLSAADGLFMLSVGMILVEYFEPLYKHIGIKLFGVLLNFGVSFEIALWNDAVKFIVFIFRIENGLWIRTYSRRSTAN